MRTSYVVRIEVPLEEFRRTLAGLDGAVLHRELSPGRVVVLGDRPLGTLLPGLAGVVGVTADLPRPLD
ncbi:hypothetical protein [Nonomuraea soli]|uniref:Uncharacterized protein n=1 Tax=Nonomuraea soli TaxID=1032476 RepID=A0A7W0CRU2_9ACTN|nr:hypothetical protein [Nonomuraea soli]MBA2896015.1 hypothetical protein [Nonomuraea soli]